MKRRKIFVKDLLLYLGNKVNCVKGDIEGVYIDNLADVSHTNRTTLDWVDVHKIEQQIIAEKSNAQVVLVSDKVAYSDVIVNQNKILIYVADPKLTLTEIGNEYFVDRKIPQIHPSSVVAKSVKIGKNVFVGPHCIIEDNVEIGDNCYFDGNIYVYGDVKIGNDCVVKPGAVIGGTGFGFEVDENENRLRFPQIGGVRIGNNVEIGANTCIDRGALSNTIIEDFVKIDNLCHIAHNVHIKQNAMIIACSEISGSCVIGENVWVGPNTSIRDWRNVNDNAFVGMGSVVVKDIPENEVWAGSPAKYLKNK